MKKLHKMTALILTGMTAVTLLAGCGAQPAAQTDTTPESTPAAASEAPAESEATTATETPAQTPAPEEQEAPKLKQVKINVNDDHLQFRIDYDEEGRVSAMAIPVIEDADPTDPLNDETLYVDYTTGTPVVHYLQAHLDAYAAAYPDAPVSPSIEETQTYDDGTLKRVIAGCGAVTGVEFNADGLPAYIIYAQEDISHKLTYTQDADGRYTFAGGEEIYGHFDSGTDTPYAEVLPDEIKDGYYTDYEGWVEYQ